MPLSVGPIVMDPNGGLRRGYYIFDEEFAGIEDDPVGKTLEFEGVVLFGIWDHHAHPTLASILAGAVDLSGCTSGKCVERLLQRSHGSIAVGVNYGMAGNPEVDLDRPWIVFSRSLHRLYHSEGLEPEGPLGWFGTILNSMDRETFEENLRWVLSEFASLGYSGVSDMYTLPGLAPRVAPIHVEPYCPVQGCMGLKVFLDGTLEGGDIMLGRHGGECPIPERTEWAAVHAMGDGAVDVLLHGCSGGFRIEHAIVLRDDQIGEISRRGIPVCVQPSFLEVDREMAPRVLGERIVDSFRFGSLEAAGVRLLIGSDYPVGRADPMEMLRLATGAKAPPWFQDPMSLEGFLLGLMGPRRDAITIFDGRGFRTCRIAGLLPS